MSATSRLSRIGLTSTGAWMAIAAVCLVGAGTWANYPELVTLGLAAAGALLVAALWLVATPRLTAVREVRPRRVFEGSAAQGTLTVTNVGKRGSPPLVITETLGENRATVTVPPLAAGHDCTVSYPLPVGRRGRYVIPPVRLGHSDPMRLLQRGRAAGGELVVHVYPRVHLLAMNTLGGAQDAEGHTTSNAPLGGAAFHSLREYVPGDDWRRIHWGATARTGTVMARHVVVPDEPRQLIVLDTSSAPYPGTLFEDAVRVAASFCVAAEGSSLPLLLRTTGGAERESSGTALELLSTVRRDSTDRGLAALSDLVRDVVTDTQGVALVVVTGRVDAEAAQLLMSLRPRFLSVSLAQLVSPDAAVPARPRGVLAVAAANSDQFATNWNRLVLR
ncbi:Uncharacterized conserved protein, DUF58 family, contains vWF domain [Lentzea albidocapillata subsp. violacea]|uniref:Uncharacterized conserved protein, DUF58 family, contains vWF domain n=1 Tax=Lentzea albidocapillata subsp. violacea TaxID=128104 RepID=A0A1G9QWX6_9PSEU|nr:DUF58 domain-containing protein [Lentzea albidocapillata]SDM15107.1 Uncharacterized conserved protein, DUF58 family, contains vWF domain [Lentzea albidocapillata subsp. violacea]